MKFNEETMSVLKSFSGINPGLIFKPGNNIRTMSPQKTVIASAVVEETFETNAAVYDLSRFLASVSLFESPDIKFGKDRFTIADKQSSISYTFAAENMVIAPPVDDIDEFENPIAVVDVAWDDIQNVIRAAGILQLPEIAFTSTGNGVIMLAAVDAQNPTADRFDVTIADDGTDAVFNMIIKVDNLKLLPANYKVSLSDQGVAHFKSTKVQYWIALSAKS
ncbi:MAG: hypothetical protein COA84_13355 [Robiginitomaculum sp.]|nr:MAG: hypothetical protein COA84_13355 [Robiginitomaculum sp.]